MQPGQLYNQLRFNLDQPYDVNKLAVRHRKPYPIKIERASSAPVMPAATVEDEEERLSASFKALSLAKLKEAQFLAKRDLIKQQKNGKAKQPTLKSSPSKPSYTKQVKVKISPTKKLHHLPVSGNSPPVRDVPNKKLRPNRKTNQPHSPKVKSKKAYSTHAVQTDGILREKLDDKNALHMPDVHKLAMQQLLQVQTREHIASPSLRNRNKRRLSTPTKSRKGRATGVRFSKPSKRAESARMDRERIYRPCLSKPSTKARRPSARTRGQVLPRHPVVSPYDPDYVYVEPEHHLQREDRLRSSAQERSSWLPDANEFLDRMNEAKRASEGAYSASVDPTSWLDVKEKKTRTRFEPSVAQREISPVSSQRTPSGDYHKPGTVHSTTSPLYNREMSSEEQPYQSVEGQTRRPKPSDIESTLQAIYETPQANTGRLSYDVCNEEDWSDESSYSISPEDRVILQTMLNRLDEMQKEHVEMRHRWLAASAKYDNAGLIHLDERTDRDDMEADGAVFEPPHALLYKKPHFTRPPYNSQTVTFSDSAVNAQHNKSSGECHDGVSTHLHQSISLPERKIKSIQDGKERFEKTLADNSHIPSAGFDPWNFAKRTADEVLDGCITQVSKELLDAGDGIVQKLYSDEFVAAKHSASQQDITPPT